MVLHNTCHILSESTQESPSVKLQAKYATREGNDPPCVYCLASDGKCKLQMCLNSTKKYVPQASSCLYGRYVKISIKSVDKRQITSKNPCTNRAWMCPELDCRTPFWKVYSELHYTSAHPGTSIPSEVKMSEAERKEVLKKKYLEGYQIIKLSKEQEKSKSKRAQRKSHLSHL